MKINSLLMAAVFCVGAVCIASAKNATSKSYSVWISGSTTVGSAKLAEGEYKVSVAEGTATFASINHKPVTAPVKVDAAAKKFDQTQVLTSKGSDGTSEIKEIDLGGSTTKLEFGM